jgi:metal-responsive CopG/Arc/MetJ family transcriptional regulator
MSKKSGKRVRVLFAPTKTQMEKIDALRKYFGGVTRKNLIRKAIAEYLETRKHELEN